MPTAADHPPTLYLLDGHAQFFRAYHAIRSGMSSPVTKEPTNLTFGFVGMILRLLRECRPDYLAVVIDAAGDRETFRSEIDPQYKANREPPPQDFGPQVERCLSILGQMRVPVVAEEGVEADDAIATIVRRVRREHPEMRIRIVSKDKDLAQLLDDRTELFDVHTGQVVTTEDLFQRKGVTPAQVPDMLALMGDASDNIPGVKGIGPKTAAELITTYGSLDNLLAHLDEIKGKRRENIEAARERLPINQSLVRLKEDLPFDFPLEQAKLGEQGIRALPVDALLETMRQLAFHRYQDELKELAGGASREARAELVRPAAGDDGHDREADGTLFGGALREAPALLPDTTAGDYRVLRTAAEAKAFVSAVRASGACAIDTETDSLSPVSANLCGVSLAHEPGAAVYVPVRSPEAKGHLSPDAAASILRPLVEDPSVEKTGHNLKFDLNVFRGAGMRLRGIAFDSMVASYLVDPSRSSHGQDALALGLLGHQCTPISAVIGSGRNQRRFDEAPLEVAGPYAAEDADIALRLRAALEPQIESMGLRKLFDEVEMPLVEVLAELEWNGIRLDPDELDRQRTALSQRIDALRQRIVESAPHPFNPDSPRQLAVALFNKPDADPPGLGLRVVRRGKTGPSTDQEVLEKLAADPEVDSPLPELIVEYRQLTKLLQTYLVALKAAIDPRTGRVHASFNQTVAATGRLSSSDPNLQNIPIRTEVGREIRRAFVADPGCVLIGADYSQIELRLLAHLSDDPALIEAFEKGLDIHTAVAAEVFGVELDAVTPEQRSAAKMVNFGIVYGITPFGLARRLGAGTSVERAAAIINDYKGRFARIDAFLQRCVRYAEEHGFVETILGRRRPIPQVRGRNPQERALGERMAINTVVQGSAADLIKIAMVDLYRRLPERFPNVRMLLQIHDELVFEAPEDESEAVRAFVVERMEKAMVLKVPLMVESSSGRNWAEAG
ncbi:MAG: DNA polymerase I [Phycisphaerales bacterium]|nr:DNA polymerase I [Phycisphaerales bacterium]